MTPKTKRRPAETKRKRVPLFDRDGAGGLDEDATALLIDARRVPLRTRQRRLLAAHEADLRTEVRRYCLRAFAKRFGRPWDDDMSFWVVGDRVEEGIDHRPALERAPPGKRPGGRGLEDRAFMIRFFGGKTAGDISTDKDGKVHAANPGQLLSANELAVISLLGGNWPTRVTQSTERDDVLAAEVDAIKKAMSRHASKKIGLVDGRVMSRGSRGRKTP